MGITKSKGHKELNDKFYTKQTTAKRCIDLIDISAYDMVVEPSAGSGSFSNQIPNCIAYDLIPENENIIKQDYFKLDTWIFYGKKVLTIGNPPFGIQNNLAIKFFNKAAEYSDTIAFILPKSFMKESIQDRLDPYFHLEEYIELPNDSFLLNGESYSVQCVFQIWKRKNVQRKRMNKTNCGGIIEFVKDDFDFAIWRVGGKCGKAYIPKDKDTVSRQSNYLVKNISIYENDELIDMINKIEKKCVDYSVGPKSISKTELMNYIFEAERQKK